MSERLYRTQILLRPEQHRKLVILSKEEGKSISEITRTLLDEALLAHQNAVWAARSHVLERLRILRNSVRSAVAVDPNFVEAFRNEREDERPWR
jgi:hypothetical protein